jgi:hypothetical protein
MKKLILLSVFTVALAGFLPAMNQNSVKLLQRQKAYEHFHAVKDTVTVRTWMNMDRMNKALIQVVEYDNQLLESYKNRDTTHAAVTRTKADTVVQIPVIAAPPSVQKSWFDLKYLPAVLIAVGILLLIFIVLLARRTISLYQLRREYNERDETFDAKLNRLDFLENEVVKMKTRENEIKAELEKGIVNYQDKMETLRKRIDELANENTRLENIIALKTGRKESGGVPQIDITEDLEKEINKEPEILFQRIKKARK